MMQQPQLMERVMAGNSDHGAQQQHQTVGGSTAAKGAASGKGAAAPGVQLPLPAF